MARRTIYLDDEIDAQLTDRLDHGDSFSALVQTALVDQYDLDETASTEPAKQNNTEM